MLETNLIQKSGFIKETPILTHVGYKMIDELQENDLVYTQTGDLKKVRNKVNIGVHKITVVQIDGLEKIETTSNQKFYVLYNGVLDWIECKDIRMGSYICVSRKDKDNVKQNELIPEELLRIEGILELNKLYAFRQIYTVKEYKYEEEVFNIEIEDNNGFIVNGAVVK